MSHLRKALIRVAFQHPELRPDLLPLLKTAGKFPQVERDVEADYRRRAITVGERDELLRAIQEAESLREAQQIVSDHRRGRVASGTLQRSDARAFLIKEMKKIPGVRVKSQPQRLEVLVSAINPEVKSVVFSGSFDKDRVPFWLVLKNGDDGWGWDAFRQPKPRFNSAQNELRLDIVFDGKRDPARELRAFVQHVIVEAVKKAGMVWRPDTGEKVPLSEQTGPTVKKRDEPAKKRRPQKSKFRSLDEVIRVLGARLLGREGHHWDLLLRGQWRKRILRVNDDMLYRPKERGDGRYTSIPALLRSKSKRMPKRLPAYLKELHKELRIFMRDPDTRTRDPETRKHITEISIWWRDRDDKSEEWSIDLHAEYLKS